MNFRRFFRRKPAAPPPPVKSFKQGMTIGPGEAVHVPLSFSEEELLEMLFQAQNGNQPCIQFSYDQNGVRYSQRIPIPMERLQQMLDGAKLQSAPDPNSQALTGDETSANEKERRKNP